MDSVVLLHLLHELSARFSWQLSALHVHHGISPNADAWAEFCADFAPAITFPCISNTWISRRCASMVSKLRRASCAMRLLPSSPAILWQWHTMPTIRRKRCCCNCCAAQACAAQARCRHVERAGSAPIPLVRPLLHCSRQEILDYAAAHQLHWIEDESNADDSYPRNFLRHRVLPLLGERFPAYRDTLARSAQHFAEAGSLLDDLAQQDAIHAIHADTLDVAALQALSLPRAKNLLRFFLHRAGAPMPQAVQLDDMLRQLRNARQDASVCVNFSEWQVRRYQGRVYALRALGEFDPDIVLPWHGEAEMEWPR